MGTYRTVVASFPCAHCRELFANDVQFETGEDRDLPRYAQGQCVAGDPLLRPGSVFEASADRYCPTCSTSFSRDHVLLVYAALFELVDAGSLVLRQHGLILNPSELLALKNSPRSTAGLNVREWLSSRSLSLHARSDSVDHTHPTTSSVAVARVEERSAQLLSGRGWHLEDGIVRDDLRVVVSDSSQLWVALPASPNVA